MAMTTTRAGIGRVRWRDARADGVTDEQWGGLADAALEAVR